MRPLRASVVSVVALALALAAAGSLADRFLADLQWDATERGLFTLSPGTREVLAASPPVALHLYASRRLGASVPAMGVYGDRVVQMLRRYVAASGGRLSLTVSDPEPFSTEEDAAIAAGLRGVPLDRTGEQAYFGVVGTNLLDDERTIGFFAPDRERFLEYDLTRLVHELADPHRARVAVLSDLPLDGAPGVAPAVAMLQLRQAFTVTRVAADATAIDADVLVVAHPQHLAEPLLRAVDRFVMGGGGLLLLLDPHSETQAGQGAEATASDFPPLRAWGVGFDPEAVAGQLDGAWRVRGGADERVQAIDYPPWFTLRDGFSRDDPATAALGQVTFAAAGTLTSLPGATATFAPLLTGSAQGGTIPATSLRGEPDPVAILAAFHPDGTPRVLAARLRGRLVSAYPDGPGPAATDHANVVVIADSDVLNDRFWVRVQDVLGQPEARPFADNGALVTNLVGTLAGGDALLGLRGRGAGARPLEALDTLRAEAERRYRSSEQELRTQLDATVKRLAELRAAPGTESEQLIDEAVAQIAATRAKLRGVQLDLRRDTEALETRWRLLCIGLAPALVALAATLHGLARRRAA